MSWLLWMSLVQKQQHDSLGCEQVQLAQCIGSANSGNKFQTLDHLNRPSNVFSFACLFWWGGRGGGRGQGTQRTESTFSLCERSTQMNFLYLQKYPYRLCPQRWCTHICNTTEQIQSSLNRALHTQCSECYRHWWFRLQVQFQCLD